MGVAGCLLGGWGAYRFGRSPTAAAALVISGLRCLVSPWACDSGPAVLNGFCLVWGRVVLADSGVFSTALSETADPRYVGTALTMLSIQLVPLAAELVGWHHAFLLLVPGLLIGAIAMRAFGARGTGGRTRTTGGARVG